jgi:hypothetical protein
LGDGIAGLRPGGRSALLTCFLGALPRVLRLDEKMVVEKVVKGWKGLGFMEVIENREKINFRKCHSYPMLCDIMVI